ncbi:MAG TPA: dephospho-CoA kinase [Mycobacteriales bacterium]|nr:dephospho-CoA kinase [Mycobacteriales bacterium]
MLIVGLTGGIGSGKSTVSRLLASYGAVVIDADVVAREVVRPGSPGLAAVVEAFGPEVLLPDGSLDRAALGSRVFADPEALARLNGLTHPLVRARMSELTEQARVAGASVVVHDVPLLVESGLAPSYDVVVVVAAEVATQVNRLVATRQLSVAEATARVEAQAPLAAKLAAATHVVRNEGTLAELETQVRQVWEELSRGSQD